MSRWRHEDYDPPTELEELWEHEGGSLPPEEQEDWDLPPVREVLTRLACGD